MHTVTIAFTGSELKKVHAEMAAYLGANNAVATTGSDAENLKAQVDNSVKEAAAAKKLTKAPKAVAATTDETPPVVDSYENERFDLGDEHAADDVDNDMGDDALEEKPAPAPTLTKADLLKALRAAPDKEKVANMLRTKFKVANINQLKDAQYADVISSVKKLK